jgi:lysophospholipid acyltransferase (LPLAT)-like uncharacterized protein
VKMIMLLRQGYDAMVAVDGPHGPPLEAKMGAALIAQRARAVIVPTAAACNRKIELRNRWDNHLVPLPFSRTVVHFGTPIDSYPSVGPKPRLEDLRAGLELALSRGTARASAALEASLAGGHQPADAPHVLENLQVGRGETGLPVGEPLA